ncbi:MAG TPA: SRPBCC family protein [Acidimicrobiales bacterium]
MSAPETTFIAEPNSHEFVVSAVIDAPIESVWRAYVERDLFVQWWGPKELRSKVDRWDPVTGGSWRVIHIDPDGSEYGFRGVFHEVVPQQRTVMTFEFEGMPGHVCLETHTFEAFDGRTKLTQHSVFQSVADRDGMRQSGMEQHAPVAMAQLQEVARSL